MVVVLFNAGPLDITWADGNPEVTSILECFFPAQEAGASLLQVVQGEASPAGRLPFTWYRAANQVASCLIVCYLNKNMYSMDTQWHYMMTHLQNLTKLMTMSQVLLRSDSSPGADSRKPILT